MESMLSKYKILIRQQFAEKYWKKLKKILAF